MLAVGRPVEPEYLVILEIGDGFCGGPVERDEQSDTGRALSVDGRGPPRAQQVREAGRARGGEQEVRDGVPGDVAEPCAAGPYIPADWVEGQGELVDAAADDTALTGHKAAAAG